MTKAREIRLMRGLTIDDVYLGTRIDRALISRIERGRIQPTADQRLLLSKFYALPENELFPQYNGVGPEHDRDLYRILRYRMTLREKLWLLEPSGDYAEVRRRLEELAKKYDIEE
jgi:transcriptional regulator with XRE-family HTH domain